jgi:23S rRNA pseudouridine2605 synthase
MFEEIGHHVEKIKRVRYGPLTLNVEPGKSRELAPQEVTALRKSVREPGSRPERPRRRTGSAPKHAPKKRHQRS